MMYKQENNVLRIEILCLVENERKVLKTGGNFFVKNTQTSVSALLSYYLSSHILLFELSAVSRFS